MRVGRLENKWVLNPTFQQLAYTDIDLVVAGNRDSLLMVEGEALEVSEDAVVDALRSVGVDHIDMPATPARVWQALGARV